MEAGPGIKLKAQSPSGGGVARRILRGPEPPPGVPYTPRPSLRCRLGLHDWHSVWAFTRIEESHEFGEWHEREDGVIARDSAYRAEFAVRWDREPDYSGCSRCEAIR